MDGTTQSLGCCWFRPLCNKRITFDVIENEQFTCTFPGCQKNGQDKLLVEWVLQSFESLYKTVSQTVSQVTHLYVSVKRPILAGAQPRCDVELLLPVTWSDRPGSSSRARAALSS